MGLYKIEFKQEAERDLGKINHKFIPKIIKNIELLADNPFPRHSLKLSGAEATYRIKVGNYRVIYEVIHTKKSIIIHYIRHRRDAYRKF